MKYILAVIVALFVFMVPVSAQIFVKPTIEMHDNTLIIKNDLGGPLTNYMARYLKMQKERTKLAIDGECDSSCTLFFGYLPQQGVCITENAKIGFHRSNRPEGTMVMIASYPQPILMWLMAEGMTEDIKYLPVEIMQALFQKCPEILINPPQGEKID